MLHAHQRDDVTLIDTGDAVARQLGRLLDAGGLLHPARDDAATLRGYTTGDAGALAQAFADLLGLKPAVEKVEV